MQRKIKELQDVTFPERVKEIGQGRRLASRLFRRDLLEDVELYRPWLDDRFQLPLACIGDRSEVWATFEELSGKYEQAVVKKWNHSPLMPQTLSKIGSMKPRGASEFQEAAVEMRFGIVKTRTKRNG